MPRLCVSQPASSDMGKRKRAGLKERGKRDHHRILRGTKLAFHVGSQPAFANEGMAHERLGRLGDWTIFTDVRRRCLNPSSRDSFNFNGWERPG